MDVADDVAIASLHRVKNVGRPIRRHLTETAKETSMIAVAIASIQSAQSVEKGALRYEHLTQKIQTKCIGALHARSARKRRARQRRNRHWNMKLTLLAPDLWGRQSS